MEPRLGFLWEISLYISTAQCLLQGSPSIGKGSLWLRVYGQVGCRVGASQPGGHYMEMGAVVDLTWR